MHMPQWNVLIQTVLSTLCTWLLVRLLCCFLSAGDLLAPNFQFNNKMLDIKLKQSFLIIQNQAELAMVALSIFYQENWIVVLVPQFVICTVLAISNWFIQPCLISRLNIFRTATYSMAAVSCMSSIVYQVVKSWYGGEYCYREKPHEILITVRAFLHQQCGIRCGANCWMDNNYSFNIRTLFSKTKILIKKHGCNTAENHSFENASLKTKDQRIKLLIREYLPSMIIIISHLQNSCQTYCNQILIAVYNYTFSYFNQNVFTFCDSCEGLIIPFVGH